MHREGGQPGKKKNPPTSVERPCVALAMPKSPWGTGTPSLTLTEPFVHFPERMSCAQAYSKHESLLGPVPPVGQVHFGLLRPGWREHVAHPGLFRHDQALGRRQRR